MKARLRISGGRLQGRLLKAPPEIRPTAARVRESLMDIWAPRLPGAVFLDLFAGSGAVGIEAMSRGAILLVSMELDSGVVVQLHETTRDLDLEEVRIESARLPDDLLGRLSNLRREFDLVFADPPYGFDRYADLLQSLTGWLAPGGEIVVEHDRRDSLARILGDYHRVDERRYGDTCLSFFQRLRTGGSTLALPDEV